MHSHAHAHPSTCWTDAYLLEHCEGFRVDSNGVHVGYVEEVVWPDDGSAPLALRVRRGFGVGGLVLVPLADIVDLHPSGSSILVRPGLRGGSAAVLS